MRSTVVVVYQHQEIKEKGYMGGYRSTAQSSGLSIGGEKGYEGIKKKIEARAEASKANPLKPTEEVIKRLREGIPISDHYS